MRKLVFGDENRYLRFSNTYAYRGVIPMDALKSSGLKVDVQSRPLCWVGLDKVTIILPPLFPHVAEGLLACYHISHSRWHCCK